MIIRKTKDKVFVNHIEEIFQNNVSSSGIIALYMTPQEKMKRESQDRIEFEYFDKESFRIFLISRLNKNE